MEKINKRYQYKVEKRKLREEITLKHDANKTYHFKRYSNENKSKYKIKVKYYHLLGRES